MRTKSSVKYVILKESDASGHILALNQYTMTTGNLTDHTMHHVATKKTGVTRMAGSGRVNTVNKANYVHANR